MPSKVPAAYSHKLALHSPLPRHPEKMLISSAWWRMKTISGQLIFQESILIAKRKFILEAKDFFYLYF